MRYERKFICNSRHSISSLFQFERWSFLPDYPSRVVNSIYFDDSEFSMFNSSLEGDSNRLKLRARWYGNESTAVPHHLQLEVKWKSNSRGAKDIFHITMPPNEINSENLIRILMKEQARVQEFSLGRVLHILTLCQPVLQISYRREYFASSLLNSRLSIDENLNVISLSPLLVRGCINNDFKVVEIKYSDDEKVKKRVETYINSLSIPATSFSKYTWGLSQYTNDVLTSI